MKSTSTPSRLNPFSAKDNLAATVRIALKTRLCNTLAYLSFNFQTLSFPKLRAPY